MFPFRPILGAALSLICASATGVEWDLSSHRFAGGVEQSRTELTARQADHSSGIAHEYRIFDLPKEVGPSLTNGHVHVLSLHHARNFETGSLLVQPALAVSSNVLKRPEHLEARDLRLEGSLEHRRGPFRLGVRADARFGVYRPTPVLAWMHGGKALEWELGFPDSSLRVPLTTRLSTHIHSGPGGGSWRVRSRDYTQRSILAQRRWVAGAALIWSVSETCTLGLAHERGFHERWRLDGQTVSERPRESDTTRLFVRLTF